jgi:EmrB/QacA subfamily drug resistance transporter
MQPDDVPMPSRSTKIWVLSLTSVASLMAALDVLAVTTTLTTIRLELHASIGQLEWTVTAYNLAFAVLMLPASALGERFGRRRIFATGLGVFTLASAGCALAPSIVWLIALRALQGAGAAAILPLAFALISAAFPEEYRGRALGIGGGITGLAVLAGPLLGGGLTQAINWHWIFWINIPIGVLAILLVLIKLNESFGPDTTLDVRGLVLVTAAAFGVVWALVRATSTGWVHPEIVISLFGGLLLTVAFILWERRAPQPMLPMRLFRNRGFAASNLATFFHAAVVMGPVFLMAQFFQTALGYGPFESGLRLLPWTASLLVVAPIAGALADRFGQRPIVVVGLSLAALGMGWLAVIAKPGVSYLAIVLPLLIGGIGNSAVFPAVQSAAVGAVNPGDMGKASGSNQMVRELGGVLGIASLASIFAAWGSYTSQSAFAHGFSAALYACSFLGVLGALAGATIPRSRPTAAQSTKTSSADVSTSAATV